MESPLSALRNQQTGNLLRLSSSHTVKNFGWQAFSVWLFWPTSWATWSTRIVDTCMCVLEGFLILFLPPGNHVITMLGALCDGIRVHDLLKCSSHPACLHVLNNSCFCFLEYLFICDAVCISDFSDFIYTGCWKASICSLPWSHWRREL